MEAKKVLIAEASEEFAQLLCERLGDVYSLRVCNNGLLVKGLLEMFRPDVLVMDLALPGLDGISLLQQITPLSFCPRILLTTCFMSPYVEAALSVFPVDMVMLKPCNLDILTERIHDLTGDGEPEFVKRLKSHSSVAAMLLELNIPSKRRGFAYLELGIRLYLEQPGQLLTKNIYPYVAKQFFTRPDAVERAIRQVIHEAWNRRDDRIWRQYFSFGRDGTVPRPTNAEFISLLAERYRQTVEERAL